MSERTIEACWETVRLGDSINWPPEQVVAISEPTRTVVRFKQWPANQMERETVTYRVFTVIGR